jgi:polyhydroxybutyrate depolymerase
MLRARSRWRRPPRWSGLALAFVLAATLATGAASWRGASGGSSTPTSAPKSSSSGAASGCRGASGSGSSTLALSIGGHSRIVIVHLPTGYSGKRPVPLILNMHGSGSDAAQQEAVSGMDATSDADGFIVAYPQGLIPSGTGFDWNIPGVPLLGGAAVPAGAANDVAFLTDLVPALATRYCIDPRRVFATGLSGGGRISSQLACDSPSTFAAVAPVAGLRYPSPCPASRPVPIIAFHGTADPIDPYNGNGQAYWTYSVPTAAARWGKHNHCASTPKKSSGSGYTLTTYVRCGAGASVELYSLIGEGHEWPGGPRLPKAITKLLGPQSDAVSANNAMWAFFSAHPRP